MAHFAKLNDDNIVIEINVVSNEILDINAEEQSGIAFLIDWSGGHTNWKQTSYNGNIRKNYAGIGYTYDAGRDAFIPPKPFESWVLDENTCNWEAPIPRPDEGWDLIWNEESQAWVEKTLF